MGSILTACAQIKSLVTKPGTVEVVRAAQTNNVETVTTNTTQSASITNQDGTVTPPQTVYTIVTNVLPVIQPAVYFTNLAISDGAQAAVATADTTASAAGIPWSHTVATGVLALLGVGLAWANYSNKQKLLASLGQNADTQSALTTAQKVGQTLVQNFEQLRQVALTIPGYTRDIDDKVMTAIQAAQEIAGVKSDINDLVDANTNTTLPGNGTITTATVIK